METDFDNYTAEEIRTLYRNAKDKGKMRKQILPELTLLKPKQIDKILSGEEIPEPTRDRKYVPKKERENVMNLHKQGLSVKEIAEEIDYTCYAVKQCLNLIKENELEKKPRTLITEEMTAEMIELWRGGLGVRAIAEKYGIATSAVERRIKPVRAAEKAKNATGNEEKSQKETQKAEEKEEKRMKQARRYYCELCGKFYLSREEAEECTERHIDFSHYDAIQVYDGGEEYPSMIVFEDVSGNLTRYMRECR